MAVPPPLRRPGHSGGRRSRWPLSLLTLTLAAPAAQAAAYLPGAEPDPPTGDLPPVSAAAAEPLRPNGLGIDWRFAPVRWSGTIAADARWLKLEATSSRQAGAQMDIAGASYLWQPWFVQFRFGAGFFTSHDLSDGGASTGALSSKGTAVTADAGISVFPASRFPFELRANISDSRTSGESLGSEQRTHRLSLSQAYRPATGNDNYQLHVDASHVFAEDGRDSLVVFDGSAMLQRGAHRYEFATNHADNHRGDGSSRSLLTTLTARHGYHAGSGLDIDSLASWNRNRTRNNSLGDDDGDGLDTELRQLSTLATWRPRNGDMPFAVPASTQIVGSARWVEQQIGGNDNAVTASAFSATLGASADLGTDWRIAGSGSFNQFDVGSANETHRSVNLAASLGWTPRALPFGSGWRWSPNASIYGAVTRGTNDNDRNAAGLQVGQALTRDWLLVNQDALSLTITQNAGVQAESGIEGRSNSRALAHGFGLTWQQASDGSRQHFAALSASDSRGFGDESTVFQLVNLQWSQRTQITRLSSWSGNVTLQFTRSRANADPLSSPGAAAQDGSWQRFASATLSYEQQRFWGVPRLRFTVLGGLSTQQIDRRSNGDINAPLDRVSRSLEARLDYVIGRLEARLSARVARVDDRSVASIIARVQRRF